jgi:stage II sporulation protein E
MGSGYYAYQLSLQTLKMVDQITDCSIDFETSLEILNNFFKTKDALETYATLDFVDINLHDGTLNLYKMGSSTTYIFRNNQVIPIYNNNLPFGISDLIIKEQFTLKDNDLVILVSDGVTDYISENVLIDYIEKLQKEAPHKIVYEILQKIYYENNNQIKDDMSCIVIKLKEI